MTRPAATGRLQDGCGQERLASLMPERGWNRPFDEPIPLPRGRELVSLEEAGTYITKLPKAEYEALESQAAMEVLILIATSGGVEPWEVESSRRAVLRARQGQPDSQLNLCAGR
jgi:hypothetical protein